MQFNKRIGYVSTPRFQDVELTTHVRHEISTEKLKYDHGRCMRKW